MTKRLQVFLVTTIIAGGGIATPAPTVSFAKATLEVVRRSGRFQAIETATSANVRGPETPVVQRRDAVFPSVEVIKYIERVGVNSKTKRHFAGADVTLRVRNKGTIATDPVSLFIKDNNLLMRPTKPVLIPSLRPGAGIVVSGHLDAELSGDRPSLEPTIAWRERYRACCGLELGSVLEWSGPPALKPLNGLVERKLTVEAAGSVRVFADPNPSICDATHCIKPCEMGKYIKRQLDGHVVGYSFFVGLQSRYEGYGKARTAADGTERDFTQTTKISVASVSKLVTAIAAVRMLGRRGISLDAHIGPYFPSDWTVSDYVRDLNFAQLLSQTSGIKDYGNVNTDYAKLKQFFTQSVSTSTTTTCQGAGVLDPNTVSPRTRRR